MCKKIRIGLKWIVRLFASYMLFVYITGILICAIPIYNQSEVIEPKPHSFFSNTVGPDRALLIDDHMSAFAYRLTLIEQAHQSLEIAFYDLHRDTIGLSFCGALLAAADRGISIRLLLDGLFIQVNNDAQPFMEALAVHPNVQVRFYEPFHFMKPWTWNNTLHDKYMIADRQIAMIGSRNIGDRYMHYDDEVSHVIDRDVILYRSVDSSEPSVLTDLHDYFEQTWNHSYTKEAVGTLSTQAIETAKKVGADLFDKYTATRIHYDMDAHQAEDWYEKTVPTNKVTLIYNPMQRLPHYPVVWVELTSLFSIAQERIWAQSPYIIPNRLMRQFSKFDASNNASRLALTNSLASSPNYPAISGYMRYRQLILQHTDSLYEYQGSGSIHAKSFLIDDHISVIGSFNLDPRSTFLSTESMVVIDSTEFALLLEESMQTLLSESLPVTPTGDYPKDREQEALTVPMFKQILIRWMSLVGFRFVYLL